MDSTATMSSTSEETQIDGFYIGAFVCIGVGGVLLIVGFIRLAVWIIRLKKEAANEKRKRRHLEHMRYLEEYSIKTGGESPNDVIVRNNNTVMADSDSVVFKWDSGLVNAGYIGEDTLERHSPKEPKLNAHINGSSSYAGSRPNSRPSSRASASSNVTGHMTNGHGPMGDNKRASVSGIDPKDDNIRLADVPV